MAERQLHGLQRVLGVNALFSTAYGNVGSSIYYALGLVAALAAGLTPLVFVITGALFYCTATTYAEATAMYPEAGGSSLFARRAFNELWSFFTAWAQMLNYIITIAISAFFATHYAGRFTWDGFKESPGDIALAVGIVALLALVNVRGVKDAVSVNLVLAVIDFMSQLAIVALGAFLVFSPEILIDNLDFFGETPTLTQFLLAIPIGTVAYTGIETISNMAGEARDPDTTIPAAIKRVMIAVFAIYFTLPLIALSALPVECVNGECVTQLGVGPKDGGYANDPIIGVVSGMELGAFQGFGAGLRRRARRDDPHRRDERRRARHLAPDLLDGHVPPAARHDAPAAPPLPHAVRRHPRLLGLRLRRPAARPGRLPRQDLRLRRDALLLDGAPVAHLPARHRARRTGARTAAPGGCACAATSCRRSRSSA